MENSEGGRLESAEGRLLNVNIQINGRGISGRDVVEGARWLGRLVLAVPTAYVVGGHVSSGVAELYLKNYPQAVDQFVHAGLWLTAMGLTEVGGMIALRRLDGYSKETAVEVAGETVGARQAKVAVEVGGREGEPEELPDYDA